ncbi:phosphatase PAP2 family protein [Limibacter armeniacum]|uniref:phosphatase PAP2 family protein n=1 Tax=Limibacter armeniacum TaxID=466084 RepID=UPI002FE514BF
MTEYINELDKQLFLWFNGLHNDFSDQFFYFITQSKTWVPLYLIIALVMFWKFGWKRGLLMLAAIGAAVGLADFITSGIFKPWIQRPRPSHALDLEGLVHLVNNYKGGQFGFMSSHASNTMALASALYLFWRKTFSWIWVIFPWAILVAYSRIAVGVHYPGDIVAGMTVGALCGINMYLVSKIIEQKFLSKGHIHP